jgi:hypothetical protein
MNGLNVKPLLIPKYIGNFSIIKYLGYGATCMAFLG